jgi:hypothetical protein
VTTLDLFTTLRACGAILIPMVDHVRIDAPKGVLTPALWTALQAHKAAMLDLLEAFEERVAIAEFDGHLPRAEAERLAWACVLGEEQ